MISRLRGTLVSVAGEVVELATAAGVVYEVHVPLSVAERLPGVGKEVELRTAHVVREDRNELYGFLDAGERALFQRVITAQGVGARLAVAMLSTFPAPRLARILVEKDVAALVQVSGVGKKKAEKLFVELSDRMKDLELASPAVVGSIDGAHAAVRALVALGIPFQDADRAVRAALDDGAAADTDELIRKALALT